MKRWVSLLIFLSVSLLPAQQNAPDLILSNGKIITVDERFTIAQAVAIKGDRIAAVGTNADIARLGGPATRRIDLKGRSVIPGLIDNHLHLLRAGSTMPATRRLPATIYSTRSSTVPGQTSRWHMTFDV